ncbi:phage protein GemA/Gp16 family protein [Aeromonas sp. FDAARGOS 1402]|uniref:phage protein GemA/Gp16 family protein n=1 Tax=Aeromonas sp. FDAARGOS 1402 TaxID=2778051 RepID=UPI00349F40BB
MHRHGLLCDGSETALNHYVARQTVRINNGVGVAEVSWLDGALAYSVESLKHWHKREMVKALQAARKLSQSMRKPGVWRAIRPLWQPLRDAGGGATWIAARESGPVRR